MTLGDFLKDAFPYETLAVLRRRRACFLSLPNNGITLLTPFPFGMTKMEMIQA